MWHQRLLVDAGGGLARLQHATGCLSEPRPRQGAAGLGHLLDTKMLAASLLESFKLVLLSYWLLNVSFASI